MQVLIAILFFPAYALFNFFNKHDPGGPEPREELRNALLFGLLALGLTLGIGFGFEYLVYGNHDLLNMFKDGPGSLTLFWNVLFFATVEEVTKFVPLALFIYKRPNFNEVTDGVIYFTVVGLTFGVIESFFYSLSGGTGVAILRLVFGLFFHAALTALVGYFLAKNKVLKTGIWQVVLALIGVSLLHAVYNFGLFSSGVYPALALLSFLIAVGMNALLFWIYYEAVVWDTKRMKSAPQVASPVMLQNQQVTVAAQPVQQPPTIQQHPPRQ